MYEKYKERFDVVSLSTDPYDTDDILTKYAEQKGLTFHVGSDSGPGLSESVISEIQAMPVSLFVDRFGNIAYCEEGALVNPANLDRLITYFLSDDYTQSTTLTQVPEPKPDPKTDEEALSAALNAEGGSLRFYNSDDSTVWPMVPMEKDGHKGVMTTNKQVDDSTSSICVKVKRWGLLTFIGNWNSIIRGDNRRNRKSRCTFGGSYSFVAGGIRKSA